jgi:protoheme IX farnesyltransferase
MKPATELANLPDALLATALPARLTLPVDRELIAKADDSAIEEPLHARTPGWLTDRYELTKPRMNFLVLVTTFVGYFMTTTSWSDWRKLAFALIGTAMTAAGSAILNQLIEIAHDQKMRRTRLRALAAGRISAAEGLVSGTAFSVLGLATLWFGVNHLTAILGALTLGSYVVLYTPLKRLTSLCTIVGAIPGALPPVMGVAAATGKITPAGVMLFAILFLWQMPHFLAIAILYRDDYARGGFKMLPVVDGDGFATARMILIYSMALVPVSLMPTLFNVTGVIYFAAALVMGLAFLGFGIMAGLTRTRANAKQLFFASIIYLPLLLAAMMIDKVS